jgi:hypothetical protein
MSRPKRGPLVIVYVVLAVAVVLVLITGSASVVAYLAALLTAVSVVLKVLRGDREA